MKSNIEQLLSMAVQVNELFMKRCGTLSTTVGLLDKALRKQGNNSEAVTIDSAKLGKKLMFIILDEQPNIVGVGVGEIGTDDFSFLGQYELEQVTETIMFDLLTDNMV